ncbi:hypothetical protein P22_1950 [Propionispora sp. 2/2-37]|uniref:hypothetical protein n=1 Tax=Propionispora sp. 2/2-37 TaxID=1677858 RepID=UPI0006BB7EFB|nr:hypothetical protein [Propionispora sp. 2/2-37]CUH95864.1 hypothetical protein P22_1950 [Propionispora sp. 2/2-37]
MVKVNYDAVTGEILGFYPDFVQYESIPEPHIEIDEAAWQDCTDNPGRRRVDLAALKIVEYTPEPETQIITPPVDEEKADLWEAILALTEKIETLEGGKA